MFERETKREKILESRQRELRLKERSRSEQSKEEDTTTASAMGANANAATGANVDGEESPEEMITRAEAEFFEAVEAELKRREKEEEKHRVRRPDWSGWCRWVKAGVSNSFAVEGCNRTNAI